MAVAKTVKGQMQDSSWIRRMFELGVQLRRERGAENVFDLSLGNPVMEPPAEFFAELRRIADNPQKGMHRYMPNAGYPETRQAVADALRDETAIPYALDHVMMSVGAGGGINVVIHAICDPGDEVVLLAPYFAEYPFYTLSHGARPVVVRCDRAFNPDLADLAAKITPRTRALLLNSPNNPAGVVYAADVVAGIARVLGQRSVELGTEIFLISDEPYRKVIFDGMRYPFPQHVYRATITVSSHSKDLALPGERIGYVALHPGYTGAAELMDALVFCNRVLGFVNAPALMQHIVRPLQHVTVDVSDYQRKRDYLYGELTAAGYKVVKPQGAFYMFPEAPLPDELELVAALQRHGTLVVPGRGFGLPGYFRVSYCVEQEVLEGAMRGFRAVVQG